MTEGGKKQHSAPQLAFDKTGEDVCCTQAESILIYLVHSFVSAPNPAENAPGGKMACMR